VVRLGVTPTGRPTINLLITLEGVVVLRRLGLAVLATGISLTGLVTGTAAAAPSCADYHWIGAAGSGQRDAEGLSSTRPPPFR
jgi:hypothetical protein